MGTGLTKRISEVKTSTNSQLRFSSVHCDSRVQLGSGKQYTVEVAVKPRLRSVALSGMRARPFITSIGSRCSAFCAAVAGAITQRIWRFSSYRIASAVRTRRKLPPFIVRTTTATIGLVSTLPAESLGKHSGIAGVGTGFGITGGLVGRRPRCCTTRPSATAFDGCGCAARCLGNGAVYLRGRPAGFGAACGDSDALVDAGGAAFFAGGFFFGGLCRSLAAAFFAGAGFFFSPSAPHAPLFPLRLDLFLPQFKKR